MKAFKLKKNLDFSIIFYSFHQLFLIFSILSTSISNLQQISTIFPAKTNSISVVYLLSTIFFSSIFLHLFKILMRCKSSTTFNLFNYGPTAQTNKNKKKKTKKKIDEKRYSNIQHINWLRCANMNRYFAQYLIYHLHIPHTVYLSK